MRLKEIAILTPYSAQKETIKQLAVKAKLLNEKRGEEGAEIKVATITESQGMKQKVSCQYYYSCINYSSGTRSTCMHSMYWGNCSLLYLRSTILCFDQLL